MQLARMPQLTMEEECEVARTLTVAAVQFPVIPVASFEEFRQQVLTYLDQAQAQIVVFPELFTVGLLGSFPNWRGLRTSDLVVISGYTSAYLDFFTAEAKARGQYLVAGSHLVNEGGRYFNTCHVFYPDGRVFRHRKTHIFPAERQWFTEEGDDLELLNIGGAKVGITVCYEAEIPECPRILTVMGAELLVCPSYTFSEYGYWRVRHCCQANAISNQVYVLHCCTVGTPGAPLPDAWGRSAILSPCDEPWEPDGVVVQAQPQMPAVISAELDLEQVHVNRAQGAAPTYHDRSRRKALYRRYESLADARWPGETPGGGGMRGEDVVRLP